ncbi:hypothetical protein OGAPHI_005362 [Ogataea philodendri]|uniref:Uncharacterized protein n=1 Tax=Ogataea philodendri TaxID=1378263 RepID=A0A9P8P226_9ASCO|nr:uncharacterized protein OGAPHI_005362 [Ogataea philodendri]KAH3663372.1 hypothetical protein OGAPHI_005362 [Ogataea philodendri]
MADEPIWLFSNGSSISFRLAKSLMSLNHFLVQGFHLVVVAVEQRQERGLGSGGSLDTTESQIVSGTLHVSEIPEQLLDPQGGSFSNSSELGRLEMGPSQDRQVFVLQGELGQSVDHVHQLWDQHVVGVSQENEIGIISDIARGGSQMDDSGSSRTGGPENMDVGHHVVSYNGLLFFGSLDLLVGDLEVLGHLLNSFVSDHRKTERLLGDSQVVPQLSPGGESVTQREDLGHLLRRVPRRQRGGVVQHPPRLHQCSCASPLSPPSIPAPVLKTNPSSHHQPVPALANFILFILSMSSQTSTVPNGTLKPEMPVSDKKNRKLRKKASRPQPVLKFAWIGGHVATIIFSLVYLAYYVTRKSHKLLIPRICYRLSFTGVWISYSVAIASQFNRKSLPSYFTLMATENFQYLVLSVAWFFGRSSFFKLAPYILISTLQLASHFHIKPILKADSLFEKAILYDQIFVFAVLVVDTLLMRGNSGFGLVIYAMFFWLRLLYSEDTRFFLYSVINKLDSVMSKQKNPKVVETWSEVKKFLSIRQSKFESEYLAQ